MVKNTVNTFGCKQLPLRYTIFLLRMFSSRNLLQYNLNFGTDLGFFVEFFFDIFHLTVSEKNKTKNNQKLTNNKT